MSHCADRMPQLYHIVLQKVDIFYSLFFFKFTLLLPEALDLKTNVLLLSSLLLSFPFFHPPASLGYLLRVRFSARLRASVVQRLPDEEETAGQRQWEGEGPVRKAVVKNLASH